MNSEDRDESGSIYTAADIIIALALCAAATLGMVAAFLLIELARRVA